MGDVDYSGAGAIREVAAEVRRRGAAFVVCQLEPGVADLPRRYGLEAGIGERFDFVEDVIAAYDKLPPEPSSTPAAAGPASPETAASG